jgi:SAM-dependent methyltransferase
MRSAQADLPQPDPSLHKTGSEGLDGNRGLRELRMLEHFGLLPSSDLLDIGCGIGRLAYECASFLDEGATYTGIDIAPVAIEWLNANYAPHLPGFRFDLLDVHSERYRPDGSVRPDKVRLPYDDGSFDMVCAFEVFMHLPLEGVRNYLQEIARVLRPGGAAVVTLVAIYPDEDTLVHGGRKYVKVAKGVHTLFPRRKATSMAYDIGLFRSMLGKAGLEEVDLIKGRVHIPVLERPGVKPGVEIPPLSHACDVFALRTPGADGPR